LYQVGDNIFYPMHGAGKIKAIEEKEVGGEMRQYYVINMAIDDMRIMIPKKTISKTNIRPVTDLDTVKEVAAQIDKEDTDNDLPWKRRHKANTDKIKTGDLKDCVEVIYGLLRMKKEDKLNSSEKRLLNQAKDFLLSELKLVEGMTKEKKDKFLTRLTKDLVAIS